MLKVVFQVNIGKGGSAFILQPAAKKKLCIYRTKFKKHCCKSVMLSWCCNADDCVD